MEENKPPENSDIKQNLEPPTSLPIELTAPSNEVIESSLPPNNHEEIYKKKEYRISVINTVTNIIIGAVTLALFSLAFYQNSMIRESSNAAVVAAREAERSSNIAYNQYKLSVESAKENDSVSRMIFKRESDNAQEQIKALKEQLRLVKEQFEIENRPYLYIIPLPFNIVDTLYFHFQIVNSGKMAAKINGYRARLLTGTLDTTNWKNKFAAIEFTPNQLVAIKDSPTEESIREIKLISEKEKKEIYNGTLFLYFYLQIEYVSPTIFKNKTISFLIRFVPLRKNESIGRWITLGMSEK